MSAPFYVKAHPTDPHIVTFTNRRFDGQGFGVINGTTVTYTPLQLGTHLDNFDVNNAVGIAILPAGTLGETQTKDYAFVTGFNRYIQDVIGHDPNVRPGPYFGANVGIIEDPFAKEGPSTLVAATMPLPFGAPDNLTLSVDGTSLFIAYRALGSIWAYDVANLLKTIDANRQGTALQTTPLDDLQDINAPIFKGSVPTGFRPQGLATDNDNSPKSKVIVKSAYFFVNDDGQVVIKVDNSKGKKDVTFTIEADMLSGPEQRFLEGIKPGLSKPITAKAGQVREEPISLTQFLDQNILKDINEDRLYGAKLTIKTSDGVKATTYVYRFLDAADADHKDGVVEFADTTVDGLGGVVQKRPVEFIVPDSAKPSIEIPNPIPFTMEMVIGSTRQAWLFDPEDTGPDQEVIWRVITPLGNEAGKLKLIGDGERQKYFIDVAGIEAALATISASTNPAITSTEHAIIASQGDRSVIAQRILATTLGLLSPFSSSLEYVASPLTTDTVVFTTWTSATPNARIISEAQEYATRNGIPPENAVQRYLDDNAILADSGPGRYAVDITPTTFLTLPERLQQKQISRAQAAFELSKGLNGTRQGSVDIYLDKYFTYENFKLANFNDVITSRDGLINTIAKTIAHELGHNVGLLHTTDGNAKHITDKDAHKDIMAQGFDFSGELKFRVTEDTMRIGLGDSWSVLDGAPDKVDVEKALKYLGDNKGRFDVADAAPGGRDLGVPPPGPPAPRLVIHDATSNSHVSVLDPVDLGSVHVDGLGGERSVRTLRIINRGNEDLIVNGLDVIGDARGLTVDQLPPNTRIRPEQSVSLSLVFDPVESGTRDVSLRFRSNDPFGDISVRVVAVAQSLTSDIQIEAANTNLGGLALGAAPKRVEQLATITNIGAQPLSIYDIRVVEGADQFAVGGLPQAISKNTPLVLQPNQSQTLGVLFDAAKLGLQRGVIQIYTNDPETPIQKLTVIGTGLPDGVGPFDQLGKPGHDFVAVQAHRGSEPAQRTVSDAEGTWAVTVTPNTLYRVVVFDPESGLTAEGLV
ncbi:MAG: choice-of-anchor D domain-containing protein, partial [Nitrospira sp.]|nr:choice-of-anchor D domain-containing protein [Nitrospira sp.]